MVIIDNVRVIAQEGISEMEVDAILTAEKKLWAAKGEVLGEVYLQIDGDEILVKSFERSPIKRVRRITGYLSTEDRFNDAKYAELKSRIAHL